MTYMKKIFISIVSLLCIAVSLWLVTHNQERVTLSLGFATFSQPQWVWLLLFSFWGFLLTALGYQVRVLQLKLHVRQLKKKCLLQKVADTKVTEDVTSSKVSKISTQHQG